LRLNGQVNGHIPRLIVHTYTYAYTHIHIHTHTHIHTHPRQSTFHIDEDQISNNNHTLATHMCIIDIMYVLSSLPLTHQITAHLTSITAHHTSYIIHHTSYIIHHTSYIIHHTSYIIHHTSYIIHIHHTQFTMCVFSNVT